MSGNIDQQGAQQGQFGQQGQYGAVTGQGFGGGLAKDAQGNSLQGSSNQQQQQGQQSSYEGYTGDDSSASGGYGRNAGGSAFSRSMGADRNANTGDDDNVNEGGNKTGASTPGYRKEGEENENSQFRGQNLGFTKNNNDEPEI